MSHSLGLGEVSLALLLTRGQRESSAGERDESVEAAVSTNTWEGDSRNGRGVVVLEEKEGAGEVTGGSPCGCRSPPGEPMKRRPLEMS